ncbi:MAG: hypothetical protein WCJ04_08625 [Actinomycetes bacterium]
MSGLTAALAMLLRSSGSTASLPPLGSGIEFRQWSAARDPLDLAASAARVLAISLLAYLLLVSGFQVLAMRSHRQRTRSLAVRLAPRFVVFFTAGLMASSTPAFAAPGMLSAEPDSPQPSTAPVMEVVNQSTNPQNPQILQPINPSQARTSLPWAADSPSSPVLLGGQLGPFLMGSTNTQSSRLDPVPSAGASAAPSAGASAVPLESTAIPALPPSTGSRPIPESGQTERAPKTSIAPLAQRSVSQTPQPGSDPRDSAHQRMAGSPTTTSPTMSTPATTGPTTTSPTTTSLTTTSTGYTVATGDNFWVISEQVLRMRIGEQPSAAQIADYSAQLIDLNRQELNDPQNPDLIVPGQIFQLPA